jgi:hypothetical protein
MLISYRHPSSKKVYRLGGSRISIRRLLVAAGERPGIS